MMIQLSYQDMAMKQDMGAGDAYCIKHSLKQTTVFLGTGFCFSCAVEEPVCPVAKGSSAHLCPL